MNLRLLKLRDYRNFQEQDISFASRLNVFLGPNGQGKTNLLESIFLLSQGDSFRFGDHQALLREGAQQALIQGALVDRHLDFEIEARILKSRKQFQLNSKKAQASDLRQRLPMVLFSPESLNSIKEGADWRRELIDDAMVLHNPRSNQALSEFRRALRARNKVLRDLSETPPSQRSSLLDVLDSLNPRFFELGKEVTWGRLRAIRGLREDFRASLNRLLDPRSVDISVEYVVSGHDAMDWDLESVSDAIRNRASALRDAELATGTSLVGPQKHEIKFLYNGKDSRIYCSQGQQRALILSFKMAQIVYHGRVHGTHPVLLLDDVLSELDASKQQALITFIQEIQTQVFLTTTDLALSRSLVTENSSVIHVENGRLRIDM